MSEKYEVEEDEKPDDQYKRAKEEWDVISPLPIIFADREEAGPYSERPSELLTLDEVTSYLEHVDISEELRQIKPVAQPTGFLAFLRKILFLGPPTLLNQSERDRIFAIAMKPFDNQEPMHARFLTTIYQKLTAQALFKCPRYGNHWEEIGFQGTDPATDLRGVGVLGLYQILFLILDADTEKLAQRIYRLSVDRKQQFPFCVMSTNITQIALQTLRQGHLNKEFNRRGESVIRSFNLFYASLFLKLLVEWQRGKTIADAGFVLKELRGTAHKSVRQAIDAVLNLEKGTRLKECAKRKESDKGRGAKEEDEAPVAFSNIGSVNCADESEQSDNEEQVEAHQEREII